MQSGSWKEHTAGKKIVKINLLLMKITTDTMGRQQGESDTTIGVVDGKREPRGSLQLVEEIRIHDDRLYTDRFTAHTSSKQSDCASKMYATKAMEFDKLNKVNSSGASLTSTKQQSLEEIVSQLNYAYSILYTPTEEALPQNTLIGIESMLHEMGQECLVMRGSKKNLVNTSCRLLISYSKNSNGNEHQNHQQESQKQQELLSGYSNICAKSSQQVDLYGLCMFYLGMVEILLNRQENISLQHLYQAKQSFEDQQQEYANATKLIDHVSSIIQHIQQQQIAATSIATQSQSPLEVLSAQQNIINKSKESSGKHSQQPSQQNKEILIKKHNKNDQSSSVSSHTINNPNKNSLPRKTSPEFHINDNQINPAQIDDPYTQAFKTTQKALQLGLEKLQKTSEPKQLSVYSPREENPFKSQLATKLFKSSHPSPAFTPRGNMTISGSSTQRDSNQQIYTSRLRTGRMKVSGKEIIIQKIKNGYFEKNSFNAEILSRNNSKSPSIIKDTVNKSLLESARKQEAKKSCSPFAIPNSTDGLQMTALTAENPQQLRDCLISQRTQKSKNVSSWEYPNDLKQYLLKEKRYSNPQFQPQDLKIAFPSQVNTHRNRNDNQYNSGEKIVSSSQLYQPEMQQEVVQEKGEVQLGNLESQLKNNNYFSYQQLEHSQGKSKFSQWKDTQQIPLTSQKDTSTNVTSKIKNQVASKRSNKSSKISGDIQQEQQTKRDALLISNLTSSYEKVLNQTNAQITQFFPQTTQVNSKFASSVDKQISNNMLDKSYQMNFKQQGNYNTDEKCNKLPNEILNLSKSFEKQSNVINNFSNHSGFQDSSSHNNNNNNSYLKHAEFNAVLKPSSSNYSRNNKNSIKKLQHPKSATLKKNSAPIVYPAKLGDQSFRTASNTASLSSAHPINNTIIPSTQSYFPHQFLQETSEFSCKQTQNPQVFSNTLSILNHTADLSHKVPQQTQIIPKTSSCTSSSKRNCFNNSSYQNNQLHSSQLEQELQQAQKHLLVAKNSSDNCVLISPKKKNTQTTLIPSKEQQKYNSTQAQYYAARGTLHQQQQPQQYLNQDYQVNRMSNISSFHGDSSNSTQDSLCFLKKKQEISKIENLFKRKESFGESQKDVVIQQRSEKRKLDESKIHQMVEEAVGEIQQCQKSQEKDTTGRKHDKQKQQQQKQENHSFSARKASGKSKISASCLDSNIYQMALKSICNFSSKQYATPMQPELGFSQLKQQSIPQKEAKTIVKLRKSSLQKITQLNGSQNSNLSQFIESNANRTNIQKNENNTCRQSSPVSGNLVMSDKSHNQQDLLTSFDRKQLPIQNCDNNGNNNSVSYSELKGFGDNKSCSKNVKIPSLLATPQQTTKILADSNQTSSVLKAFGQDQETLHEFQVSLAKRINSKLNYLMSKVNKQENDNQMLKQALKESEELSQNSELELELELDLQYQDEHAKQQVDEEDNSNRINETQ